MDETALQSDLKVKVFPEKACVEWLLFVDANRDRKNILPIHDYDIVIAHRLNDGSIVDSVGVRSVHEECIAFGEVIVKIKA